MINQTASEKEGSQQKRKNNGKNALDEEKGKHLEEIEEDDENTPLINEILKLHNPYHFDKTKLSPTQQKFWWYYKLRFQTYLIFHYHSKLSKIIEWIILGCIFLNVIAFILSTDSSITAYPAASTTFEVVDITSIIIFTIEYALRIWSIAEQKKWRKRPWIGRLRYVFSIFALIDLASIAPFYIDKIIAATSNTHTQRLAQFSTVIRILRVFRLLKAEKYNRSFSLIGAAIKESQETLLSLMFLCSVLLIIQATLLYYVQRKDDPVHFGSIPTTLWISVLMLTGVGGYETVPLNIGGKIIAGFTAFTAVALFAVPIGVIANAFLNAFDETEEIMVICKHCGKGFQHQHVRKKETA